MEKARLIIRHDFQPGVLELELWRKEGIPVDVKADTENPRKETWVVNPEHQVLVFDWLTAHDGVALDRLLHPH